MYFLQRSSYNKWKGFTVNITKCQFGSTCSLRQNLKPGQAQTVDPSDVYRHGQLKDVWWDENGAMKGLHSMNLVRVPFIKDGLVQSPSTESTSPLLNKKILDVGCGGGILSEELARLGAIVTGIDASNDLIKAAINHSINNKKLNKNVPSYLCTSIEEHCQQRKNYYDAIVASEVIEHVRNKGLFVTSCLKTLKLGGKIFFTTPIKSRLTQFMLIILLENILNILPRGTHQYDQFMTPHELKLLLEKNNCQVEKTHGLWCNPISLKWKLTNSHPCIFAMQAVKST